MLMRISKPFWNEFELAEAGSQYKQIFISAYSYWMRLEYSLYACLLPNAQGAL